jgi:long-subunit fatty acid transport protein
LYNPDSPWSFGGSLKSRQWFETFDFNSKDETGAARSLKLDLSLPLIISGGVGYRGFEKMLIAVDVRYFDYGSTKLFGESPSKNGLGWKSIWAIAAGGQYQVHEIIKVQFGYLFNQNPIPEAATIWNIQIPAINRDSFSGGVTVAMTDKVDLSFSVVHALRSTNQGTFVEIPGTVVIVKQDLTTFSLGLSFHP